MYIHLEEALISILETFERLSFREKLRVNACRLSNTTPSSESRRMNILYLTFTNIQPDEASIFVNED